MFFIFSLFFYFKVRAEKTWDTYATNFFKMSIFKFLIFEIKFGIVIDSKRILPLNALNKRLT